MNNSWQILGLLKLLIYRYKIIEVFQSAAANSDFAGTW